jgi:hypothetical protein
MLAGTLTGPKARIALALGLGARLGRDELAALLAGPGTERATTAGAVTGAPAAPSGGAPA